MDCWSLFRHRSLLDVVLVCHIACVAKKSAISHTSPGSLTKIYDYTTQHHMIRSSAVYGRGQCEEYVCELCGDDHFQRSREYENMGS